MLQIHNRSNLGICCKNKFTDSFVQCITLRHETDHESWKCVNSSSFMNCNHNCAYAAFAPAQSPPTENFFATSLASSRMLLAPSVDTGWSSHCNGSVAAALPATASCLDDVTVALSAASAAVDAVLLLRDVACSDWIFGPLRRSPVKARQCIPSSTQHWYARHCPTCKHRQAGRQAGRRAHRQQIGAGMALAKEKQTLRPASIFWTWRKLPDVSIWAFDICYLTSVPHNHYPCPLPLLSSS